MKNPLVAVPIVLVVSLAALTLYRAPFVSSLKTAENNAASVTGN